MHTFVHVCIWRLYKITVSACVNVHAYTQNKNDCAYTLTQILNIRACVHAGITKYHTDK